MWKENANGDSEMLLAGGYIQLSIKYIYNDKPGYRVICAGFKNMVFPDIYTDLADAKKDGEKYAKQVFERLHGEINQLVGGA